MQQSSSTTTATTNTTTTTLHRSTYSTTTTTPTRTSHAGSARTTTTTIGCMPAAFGDIAHPVTIVADHLAVAPPKHDNHQQQHTIIRHVALIAPAGQLVAILGGSGSGKTTLLNALAGRFSSSSSSSSSSSYSITGSVTFNGHDPRLYIDAGCVAYVQQNDYLLPCLTVRETLRFAARMRLPRDIPRADKYAMVEAAIAELGLRDCADTLIGDDHRKGISGGERRRVSVAVQLLMNPSVIFMDEPTTGLDAYTSHNLIKTLQRLCRKGRTIIVSIHQPRPSTFSLFHSLTLLAKGDVIYSGPSSMIHSHFALAGLKIPPTVNTAEFLIDITSVDSRDPSVEAEGMRRVAMLVDAWRNRSPPSKSTEMSEKRAADGDITPPPPLLITSLTTKTSIDSTSKNGTLTSTTTTTQIPATFHRWSFAGWFNVVRDVPDPTNIRRSLSVSLDLSPPRTTRPSCSVRSASTVAEKDTYTCDNDDDDDGDAPPPSPIGSSHSAPPPLPTSMRRISPLEEFSILARRSILNLARDRLLVWGIAAEAAAVALIMGGIFWRLDGSRAGVLGRQALLGTVSSAVNYLLMTFGCFKMTHDLRIFDRERRDNMYSPESFLLATIVTNSALFITHGLVLSLILYPMAGLRVDGLWHWGLHIACVVCMHLCTFIWGLFFASVSREFSLASGILNMVCAFLCTSTGYLIPQTVLPSHLRWVNRISYFSAGYRLLVSTEFSHNEFECADVGSVCVGSEVLESMGLQVDDVVVPFVTFGVNVVVVSLLSLLLLRFGGRGGMCLRRVFGEVLRRRMCRGRGRRWWGAQGGGGGSSAVVEVREVGPPAAEPPRIGIGVEGLCVVVVGGEATVILDDVSARFVAGELNVIMGSSGAGKTTLLTALMARGDRHHRQQRGRILFAGRELSPQQVSALCGFVPQDDTHHLPALTARETLRYAAMLRLPATWSRERKHARADEVLVELGLRDCADVRVGHENDKGLSGGEKRRLSIGVQIITDPRVLIVDEPTSGLDAFNSYNVVMTLKKIAASGKTVVCTIHQPRSDLVPLFDNLLLLARGGRVVYSGPMRDALPHFASFGHVLEPHTNVADFVLDLSSIDLRSVAAEERSRDRVDALVAAWRESPVPRRLTGSLSRLTDVETGHVTFFPVVSVRELEAMSLSSGSTVSSSGGVTRPSRLFRSPMSNHIESLRFDSPLTPSQFRGPRSIADFDPFMCVLAPTKATTETLDKDGRKKSALRDLQVPTRVRTPFLRAVRVIHARLATNLSRQTPLVADRLGTVFGFAAVVALYTFRLDHTDVKVQARLGVLQLFTSLIFLGMATCAATFPRDLRLLRFDLEDRAYGLEAFMIAEMLNEIPYQIFSATLFATFCLFLFGLSASVTNFVVFGIVAFALINTGESIGLSFCALVRSSPFTVQLMSALITVVSLLSGFLAIRPPRVLEVLNHVSIVRYTSLATAIAEFRDTPVVCPSPPSPSSNSTAAAVGCRFRDGDDVLSMLGFEGDVWTHVAVAMALVVCYRFVAYVVLRLRVVRG